MKRTKENYQHFAFEFRERRPGFRKEIVLIVIGCMLGGMKKVKGQIRKVLTDDKTVTAEVQEMLRTILYHEIMMCKAMSFNQNNNQCILIHSSENAAMCHQ